MPVFKHKAHVLPLTEQELNILAGIGEQDVLPRLQVLGEVKKELAVMRVEAASVPRLEELSKIVQEARLSLPELDEKLALFEYCRKLNNAAL